MTHGKDVGGIVHVTDLNLGCMDRIIRCLGRGRFISKNSVSFSNQIVFNHIFRFSTLIPMVTQQISAKLLLSSNAEMLEQLDDIPREEMVNGLLK